MASTEIENKDLRILLLSAFRYSVGRRTYMPDLVVELIKANQHVFFKEDWNDQFVKEITFYEQAESLGDACDIQTWNNFRDWCKKKGSA